MEERVAWHVSVHEVTKSEKRLNDRTTTTKPKTKQKAEPTADHSSWPVTKSQPVWKNRRLL